MNKSYRFVVGHYNTELSTVTMKTLLDKARDNPRMLLFVNTGMKVIVESFAYSRRNPFRGVRLVYAVALDSFPDAAAVLGCEEPDGRLVVVNGHTGECHHGRDAQTAACLLRLKGKF